MKAYNALLKIISRLFEFITGALLCAIVGIVFYTVVSSRVWNVTPPWANEIPLILVVWFGLLGAALGVRDKTHLAVEFLARALPPAGRAFVFRLSYALMLMFAAVMVTAGARLVLFVIENRETYPATKLPVGLCYTAIPVGGALIFLYALRHLIDLFTGKYDFTTPEEEIVADDNAQPLPR